MTTTYSDKLRIALQGDGDNPTTWGQIANGSVFELIEDAIAGYVTINISGNSNVTLTTANGSTDQSRMAMIELTGNLTGNINIIVPTVTKTFVVKTTYTGAFTTTFTTGSGTTVAVGTGRKTTIFCDGTNVYDLGFDSTTLGDLAFLDTITSSGLFNAEVVNASAIASLAVTTGKIANQAVTNEKLANGAVTTSIIASGAITASLLDPNLFVSSVVAEGFYKLPGGFVLQWGKKTLGPEPASEVVTFPVAFSVAPYSITLGTQIANSGGADDNHNFAQIYGTPTTTNFTIKNQYVGGGNVTVVVYWQAIGK